MAKLLYVLNGSFDGYIADEDGTTDWTAPDEEFFSSAEPALSQLRTAGWMRGQDARTPADPAWRKERPARLTTTQVSVIAAGIALAARAITYRANARWIATAGVRERRSEAYIDALATPGRIAAYVAHSKGTDLTVPHEQWRVFQARVEAFASARVITLRDEFLAAWNGYRTEMEQAAAAGNWSTRRRTGNAPTSTARRYTTPTRP